MYFRAIAVIKFLRKYDACKTANIRPINLANWALTCYGGSIHERLLNESNRLFVVAYYLPVMYSYYAYF
jgi:hypothetical protein